MWWRWAILHLPAHYFLHVFNPHIKHLEVRQNTPLCVVFLTLFSAFHLVMKHCISCLICYIQYFPILHPPLLFVENGQEIIQKCQPFNFFFMEPLFDWMQSWSDLEENILKQTKNKVCNKNHPLEILSEYT